MIKRANDVNTQSAVTDVIRLLGRVGWPAKTTCTASLATGTV